MLAGVANSTLCMQQPECGVEVEQCLLLWALQCQSLLFALLMQVQIDK